MTKQPVWLRFIYQDGTSVTVRNIVNAVFSKAYYAPCTYLSAKAYILGGEVLYPTDVKRVEFYIGGRKLHYGLPDSISIKRQSGTFLVTVESRGITVTLCQSEPEPGIWSQADLDDCLSRSGCSSEITCESGTIKTNYVNIAEKSTSWEAICAYSLKAYSAYPYIRSNSLVMVSKNTAHKEVKNPIIISTGRSFNTKNILSALYMQDLSGDYTTTASDNLAGSLGIVREKYLPLDQQWLHDEEQGLKMRLAYSRRACRTFHMTYVDYHGEDLTDNVLISGAGQLSTQISVSEIRIEVSPIGIMTTLYQYYDGFY